MQPIRNFIILKNNLISLSEEAQTNELIAGLCEQHLPARLPYRSSFRAALWIAAPWFYSCFHSRCNDTPLTSACFRSLLDLSSLRLLFFFCHNCIKHGWCFCCVVFFTVHSWRAFQPAECWPCLMAAVLLVVVFFLSSCYPLASASLKL